MTNYVIRRVLMSLFSLVFVILVVFLVTHMLGDPVRIMLPPDAPQELIDATREKFGLNDPLYVQLFSFLKDILKGDFGTSLWYGEPAINLVLERLPATVILASAGAVVATFFGILLGLLSAIKPRSLLDRLLTFLTIMGVSSVEFWIGLMLIIFISINLGWLPTSGYGIKELILPTITLAFRPMARIAQVTRPSIIDELNKPYILALKAKGISQQRVLMHASRNAGIVILTMCGLEFARFFTGATVVVEVVFGWPGIGAMMVEGVVSRDWPVTVAVVLFAAILVSVINLLVDLFYSVLNPQVKLQ